MACDGQVHTLMSLPLEVRHQIFKYVANREAQPEKLLRYWFEKQEVKAKAAELAAQNPSAGASRVVYAGDEFDYEEHYESDNDDEEGDSDQEEDQESDEEDDEEDDDDNDDGGAPFAAMLAIPPRSHVATGTPYPLTAAAQQGSSSATAYNAVVLATVSALTSATTGSNNQVQTVAETDDDDDYDDMQEGADNEGAPMESDSSSDNNGDSNNDNNSDSTSDRENEAVNEGKGVAGDEGSGDDQKPESSPAPTITAHRKWRHIPKFMRIARNPPPVELLLVSKLLNIEAQSWFYDVTVLHIDATGSFAHTSFFEEAFSQITGSAFPPVKNIRRVEVTFVWDTTWLRSEQADCAAAVFPALLRQRGIFVTSILAQAPNLNEVIVHWHDSAEDDEAVDLMNDILVGFLSLNAAIKVEQHYIAADAEPYRKSVAGRQRVEFQRIVDNGLDRLF